MKKTTIVSGKHTSAGNFTGYNAVGERIHVSKAQMDSLGMTADKDVKLPLFAVIGEREFETQDADGNGTGEKFTRTQALSIYKTAPELITAVNADAMLDINSAVALKALATEAGLTEAGVNALMNASI